MVKQFFIVAFRLLNAHKTAILVLLGRTCLQLFVFCALLNIVALCLFFPPPFLLSIVQKSIYETEFEAEKWFDDPLILKLCYAIQKQDVPEMEKHIAAGADVNIRGKKGLPLLYWAYPAGEKSLECLLQHGADPNFILNFPREVPVSGFSSGKTLLCMAVESSMSGEPKFKNYVDILLKYGADPDLGKTPASIAAAHYGAHTYNAFVSIVDAGANLNATDAVERDCVVFPTLSPENYPKLLYLLDAGVTYDTNTLQGVMIQRRLFEDYRNISQLNLDQQENLRKIVQWLKERGINFDAPIADPINPIKLEPVRKASPLIELRLQKAKGR